MVKKEVIIIVTKQEKSEESRKKILQAAEDLFAKKGYDATRVNEIAKSAEVNKALIYYYFNSKQTILETLLNSLINEVKSQMKRDVLNLIDFDNLDNNTAIDNFIEDILDYLLSKRKLIKVMVLESLKNNQSNKILHSFSQIIMEKDYIELTHHLREKGIEISMDKIDFLIGDFFTGIMPLVNFVTYYDDWLENYDVDEKTLKKNFIKVFKSTHFNFHLNVVST